MLIDLPTNHAEPSLLYSCANGDHRMESKNGTERNGQKGPETEANLKQYEACPKILGLASCFILSSPLLEFRNLEQSSARISISRILPSFKTGLETFLFTFR